MLEKLLDDGILFALLSRRQALLSFKVLGILVLETIDVSLILNTEFALLLFLLMHKRSLKSTDVGVGQFLCLLRVFLVLLVRSDGSEELVQLLVAGLIIDF